MNWKGTTFFAVALLFWSAGGALLAEGVSAGTELRIRLRSSLSTDQNREGDRFSATVVSPSRYEGAVVQGRISRIEKSGKLKGETRMRLKFERIDFADGSSSPLSAELLQVYESEFEDAKRTDEEGAVESGSQSREALIRGAAGAAAGALLGGLAGGKKGATVGVLLGGAAGVGSVLATGRKEIKLEQGSEILIRVQ